MMGLFHDSPYELAPRFLTSVKHVNQSSARFPFPVQRCQFYSCIVTEAWLLIIVNCIQNANLELQALCDIKTHSHVGVLMHFWLLNTTSAIMSYSCLFTRFMNIAKCLSKIKHY